MSFVHNFAKSVTVIQKGCPKFWRKGHCFHSKLQYIILQICTTDVKTYLKGKIIKKIYIEIQCFQLCVHLCITHGVKWMVCKYSCLKQLNFIPVVQQTYSPLVSSTHKWSEDRP